MLEINFINKHAHIFTIMKCYLLTIHTIKLCEYFRALIYIHLFSIHVPVHETKHVSLNFMATMCAMPWSANTISESPHHVRLLGCMG